MRVSEVHLNPLGLGMIELLCCAVVTVFPLRCCQVLETKQKGFLLD